MKDYEKVYIQANPGCTISLAPTALSWNEALTTIASLPKNVIVDLAKMVGSTRNESDYKRNSRDEIAKQVKTVVQGHVAKQEAAVAGQGGVNPPPTA